MFCFAAYVILFASVFRCPSAKLFKLWGKTTPKTGLKESRSFVSQSLNPSAVLSEKKKNVEMVFLAGDSAAIVTTKIVREPMRGDRQCIVSMLKAAAWTTLRISQKKKKRKLRINCHFSLNWHLVLSPCCIQLQLTSDKRRRYLTAFTKKKKREKQELHS